MESQQNHYLRQLIVDDVIETCAVLGLQVKSTQHKHEVEYIHAPISLFPTPFPLRHYEKAKELQPHLGVMVSDLVSQPQLIHEILKFFKEKDELMRRMLTISESFNQQSQRQNIHLCILRSDYMVDKGTDSLKLVEYNTVASSFGCLCQKVKELQTYIIDKYGPRVELNYQDHAKLDDNLGHDYIKQIADVFKRANEKYLDSMKVRHPERYDKVEVKDLWTLFVIDKEERNICDQKWIERQLYQSHGMKSIRLTFKQIGERSKVDEATKALFIDGNENGFVYYRTGYQLEQYENDKDWQTREMLELAMPIKCPSIDVQLTTFKKFQQAFNDESLLKRVMTAHDSDADQIKHLFKGIWTLEDIDNKDSEIHQIIQKAIENPHNYVIKPQKEGGGHNFYDDDVKSMLQTEDKEYLKQFLIMERINPPEIKAYMLRKGQIIESETLSELGIFSSVFMDTTQSRVIENQTFGRLLRTKGKDSNEGGVNAGFAVIDQPLILDIPDINGEIKPLVKLI